MHYVHRCGPGNCRCFGTLLAWKFHPACAGRNFRKARCSRNPNENITLRVAPSSHVRILVIRCSRDVPAGDIAEGHGWTDIDSTGRVVAAHHARHVGTGGVKARNRVAILVQHTRVSIGHQASEGTGAAWQNLDCVEGPVLDRRDAGIGLVIGIASIAIIGR
jgi:hypothetical protein